MTQTRFEETTRGKIFALMKAYADANGTLPQRGSIFENIVKPAREFSGNRKISRSRFRDCFNKLRSEGRVWVDDRTGAVAVARALSSSSDEGAPLFPEPKRQRVAGKFVGTVTRDGPLEITE